MPDREAERSLLCPDPEEEQEAEAAAEAAASAREDLAEEAPAEAADLAEDIITTTTITCRSAFGFGRAPIITATAEDFSADFSLC